MDEAQRDGNWSQASDADAPALWRQIAAVALPLLLLVALWHKRGPLVAIVAFLVYAGVLIGSTFRRDRFAGWSHRHVVLDALLILPLTLLALAYLTAWSLVACASVAVAASALIVPLAVRQSS